MGHGDVAAGPAAAGPAPAGTLWPDGLEAVPLRVLRRAVLSGGPACAGNPELFTGPSGIEPGDEPEPDRAARVDAARQVCAGCPVRPPCLAWAVRLLPSAGVWAGLTPEEIAALAAGPVPGEIGEAA
jgi:Transcription factor WhiB